MKLNLTQIARSSFALSAVALAAWAGNAQAADTDIVWTFTESYSRTDTTPTPGEPGVSSVSGSFSTGALTTDSQGRAGYQLISLLDAGAWGQSFGLNTDRGEDNFLLASSAGVRPSLLGFRTTAGTWTIGNGYLIGPAGGDYYSAFSAQPVPEPSTYAMMLAGVAAVCAIQRRRSVGHSKA
jgi:hypothetical protein